MPLRCSLGFYSTILVVLSGACVVQSTLGAGTADPLVSGFEDPPPAAKPRVWWHWIDGNVSQRGIEEDLTWLHDVGIGGVHNFDAALGGSRDPAHLVEKRIAYLTPEWRELFRFAVERANQYGMEFTIASSPGWSESGGPWVKPAQAMKKLVWSETVIDGGRPFSGKLLAPPKETPARVPSMRSCCLMVISSTAHPCRTATLPPLGLSSLIPRRSEFNP
jgi:hypothetical protein